MPSPSAIKAGKAFVLIEAVDRTGGVLRKAEQKLKRFASRMSSIGKKMLRQSIIGVAATGFMVRTFVKFDDVMKKVEARTTGTTKQLKLLRKQAQGLADDLGFKPFQIAEIQANLGQKGFNREQILGTTENIANLARATGGGSPESIGLASDLIGGAILQFEDLENTYESTARIADVFTTAVNNSNVQLESLKEGMKGIGPLANQFGLSFERTVALLGVLGNAMLEGSISGTTLKNAFTEISREGKKFNEDLEKLTGNRIDFVTENDDLVDLPSLLESLAIATQKLGTAKRSELLNDLLSKRAIVGAAAVGSKKGIQQFNELIALMVKGGGAAKKTAEIMNSGLGGALRRLSSRFDNLQIAVGEALVGTLGDFIKRIEDVLVRMTAWVEANQELVIQIAGAIIGVGLLGVALIVLAGLISVFATILGVVGTVFGLMGSGLALMNTHAILSAVALGTLAGVLFSMPDIMDRVVKSVVDLGRHFDDLLETVEKTWKGITDAIAGGDMQLAMKIAFLGIEIAWMQTITALELAWGEMINNLVTGLKGLGKALMDNLFVEFKVFMLNIGDGIRIVLIDIITGITLVLFNMMTAIAVAFTDLLHDALDIAFDAFRLIPFGLGDKIADALHDRGVEQRARGDAADQRIRDNIVKRGDDAKQEIGRQNLNAEAEIRGKLEKRNLPDKVAKKAKDDAREKKRELLLAGKLKELDALVARAKLLKDFAVHERNVAKNLALIDTMIADAKAKQAVKVKKTTTNFVTGGGGVSTAADFKPTKIIRGLEKGSVAAVEQAHQNKGNLQIFSKILSKETEAVEEMKKVEAILLKISTQLIFGVI